MVSASSSTTIVPLSQRARRPPLDPRPPSLSTSFTLVFEICSAGAKPNRIPVNTQIAARNPKTVKSIENWIQ